MVIVDGDVDVIVARLDSRRADMTLVDALARLQLAARRRGRSIRLREPCQELCELLELVGLTEVLVGVPGSGVEPGRKTEGCEQVGVQEVVQPGDPSA